MTTPVRSGDRPLLPGRAQGRGTRTLRLTGWIAAVNAVAFALAAVNARPASATAGAAQDAVRSLIAWCGIG